MAQLSKFVLHFFGFSVAPLILVLYPFFTFFFLFETILMADTSMCTHALTHTLASGFHNGYLMHTKKQNKLHFI